MNRFVFSAALTEEYKTQSHGRFTQELLMTQKSHECIISNQMYIQYVLRRSEVQVET